MKLEIRENKKLSKNIRKSIGYKATYNMKCRNQLYEVGKTYKSSLLEMCKHGFHFCPKMEDVVNYYDPTKDFILLEVEAIGKVIVDDDKVVTDEIKILRIVPKEEYNFKTFEYEYDDLGNMIKVIYPSGRVTQYEYDDRGNMTKVIYPNGRVTQYEYDDRGNMTKVIHPNGRVYQYEYDLNGNKTKEIYPYGVVYQYEYDDLGNKTKMIYPSGDVIDYTIPTITVRDSE